MISVIGEPGIGKSRLLHAFQSSPVFENKEYQWAVCQADEITRLSLNPFRYWLKEYFDFSETKSDQENKRVFDTKLEELVHTLDDRELAQSLERTRSFLGALIDLRWPDSLSEQLDAQGRYENTFIALSTMLRAESLRQPLILAFEDAHYMDEDTRLFLPYLGRTLTAESGKNYPICILATSRRELDTVIIENVSNQSVKVGKLSRADLGQLTKKMLGGDIAPALLTVLEQRAEGNPFFAEQIIRYLMDEQRLEIGSKGWQLVDIKSLDALPTDVNAILISRLDRLTRDVKEAVQTSAILGREFEIRLLAEMLEDKENLLEKAHSAVEAEIWAAITEMRYIFRQALLRDAAYNMQLRTRQQTLHKIAAEAIERLYEEQLTSHYGEIAYHLEKAEILDKARYYYRLAGEVATQAYQNSLAAEHYTRALALTSLEDIQERIELLLMRESLYARIGQRDAQAQDLATLELLAERQKNKRNRALVAQRQMNFAFDNGNFEEAENIARQAIQFAEEGRALEITAEIHRTLPLALARQNKISKAIQAAQNGLTLTRKVGNRSHEGYILNQMGLIMLQEREPNKAYIHFTQGLEIAQETGDRRLEAQALNNLGNIVGMIRCEYPAAKELFERTLEIVQEIGNRQGEGFALGNLGWIAAMQGNFPEARTYQEQALTIARETGNRYQESYSLINLGMLAVSQDDFWSASVFARQALDLTRKIGDRSGEAWSLTFLGHAYLGLNDFKTAKKRYQAAFDIRNNLEQASLATEPLAGLAHTAYLEKDIQTATKHAEGIIRFLDNGGTLEGTEEPTRIYLSLYLVLKETNDPRSDEILESAHELLQTQTSMLHDENSKHMYVHNVPWRHQIMELWKSKNKSA